MVTGSDFQAIPQNPQEPVTSLPVRLIEFGAEKPEESKPLVKPAVGNLRSQRIEQFLILKNLQVARGSLSWFKGIKKEAVHSHLRGNRILR